MFKVHSDYEDDENKKELIEEEQQENHNEQEVKQEFSFMEEEEIDNNKQLDNTTINTKKNNKKKYYFEHYFINFKLNEEKCSILIEEFIKHLLYIKGYIPILFNELEFKILNNLNLKQLTKMDKKRINFYYFIKDLFFIINTILINLKNKNILFNLIFGNSINNPKEIYLIKCNLQNTLQNNSLQQQNNLQIMKQQFIRNIILNNYNLINFIYKPKKIFLLSYLENNLINELNNEIKYIPKFGYKIKSKNIFLLELGENNNHNFCKIERLCSKNNLEVDELLNLERNEEEERGWYLFKPNQ
ncbi:hypothetical protein ABK040_003798 [Willaertia magna]